MYSPHSLYSTYINYSIYAQSERGAVSHTIYHGSGEVVKGEYVEPGRGDHKWVSLPDADDVSVIKEFYVEDFADSSKVNKMGAGLKIYTYLSGRGSSGETDWKCRAIFSA